MRSFLSLVLFTIRHEYKKRSFLLITFATFFLITVGQWPYIIHFALNSAADYEQIIIRRETDVSIPLEDHERTAYFLERIGNVLSTMSFEADERLSVLRDLSNALMDNTVWQPDAIRQIQQTLASQYAPLQYLTDNTFANEYTFSAYKIVSYDELKAYIDHQGIPFIAAFSMQFAQFTAMILSLFFVPYFSFLFRREREIALNELLHTKRVPFASLVWGKFIGVFSLCVFALLAYVLMTFILLLRGGRIDRPIMNLCVMLAYVVYYALPTLFFFTSFASMLSFVTGDSRTAIPIFFVFMAASSLTLSTRNGQIIQNVFVSPLIMNRAPFYSPLSETQACFEGINRIICVVLGVLFMRLSGRMNNHPKAVKTFLKTNWLHRKEKVSKRSASHFIWLNLKIVTSAFLVLSAAVLLLVPALFSSISHSTQIGTTLLGNVGWSAAVLFAGTYSVEYSHRTHDLMQLSKISRGRILFIRCLLNYLVLLVIMCVAYGILLYRLPTKVQTGVYPGLFTEFLITFTICALFFGVSAMTFSNYFKNTLLGVLFGLLMNAVLILFASEPSIWNVYLYKAYYSQKDVSGTLLGASSVLYGILTAILFYVNCQITKRLDRV